MAGGGTLPSGWKGAARRRDKTLAGVKAMQMGGGVHFMTGPAGIYYKPADKAAGAYEAHATFTQMEPAAIPRPTGSSSAAPILDARRPEVHLLHRSGRTGSS